MKNRFCMIRKESGLTQELFAKRIGLTKNFVSLIENGRRDPSDRTINDVCREFGVNEEWLRTGKGNMYLELSKDEYIAEFIGRILKDKEDSFKKRYIAMLSKLDEDGWEALEKVAIAMGSVKKD